MNPNPRLDDLDLSVRLQNICWIYEFKTLDDLCRYTRQEFAALRHVGRVTLAEVEALLAKHGRRFDMESEPVPGMDAVRWECTKELRRAADALRSVVERLERQHPGYTVRVHRFIHDEFEFELVPKDLQ